MEAVAIDEVEKVQNDGVAGTNGNRPKQKRDRLAEEGLHAVPCAFCKCKTVAPIGETWALCIEHALYGRKGWPGGRCTL